MHAPSTHDVVHEASSSGRRIDPWTWGGGLVIVLLVVVVVGLLAATRVLAGALDGRDAAERAEEHLFALEWEAAGVDLTQAEESFGSARRALRVFFPLRILPWVGAQERSVAALLSAGETSARVFGNLLGEGIDLLEIIGQDESLLTSSNKKGELLLGWSALPEETRERVLVRLRALLPELEVARSDVALALAELEDAVDVSAHARILEQKEKLSLRIEQANDSLEVLIRGVALLSSLSDEDGGQVLVLFLNDNELRPGGGFLGSFGLVEVDAGALSSFRTFDVMAVDGPVLASRTTPPPEPLAEYLGVPAWFLRDANWSPDFETSSRQVLQFLSEELQEGGAEAVLDPALAPDLVVGVTTRFAGDLLRVAGDVTVEGETFTADTIADTLENAVEFTFANRGVTHDRRKDIIQDIVDELRRRFTDFTLEDWGEVFTASAIRLQDKNLLVYSPDEGIQALFEREGWSGSVPEDVEGDYLLVADANMAALKTDPAVHRVITHSVVFEGDDLVAETRVRYEHGKPFGPKTTRYRTFTRFFVPEGSMLISAEGTLKNDKLHNPGLEPDEVVVSNELGKTVFGMFTSVEPLTVGELVVRYRLPERIVEEVRNGSYDLLIQKQPGAQNHALTLEGDFGTKLKRAEPPEEERRWGDTRYDLNTILDQDRIVHLEF